MSDLHNERRMEAEAERIAEEIEKERIQQEEDEAEA